MSEHRFEQIEHTADIGIEATGDTLAEAFENAACGMFSVMADIAGMSPSRAIEVRVEADDLQCLLHAWLAELIYRFDAENVLPVEFKVEELTETSLTAKVGVRLFSADIEWIGPAIKAVTYHQLTVERTPGGWRTRVIFDV